MKQRNQTPEYKNQFASRSVGQFPLSVLATAVRASVLSLGVIGASQAATIEVTSHLDDGTDCTLREAIVSINDQPANLTNGCVNTGSAFGVSDTIIFADTLASNTIILSGSELQVGDFYAPGTELEIDASSLVGGITIDADAQSRVFVLESAVVSLNSMTLLGGSTDENIGGGGMLISSSTVRLNDITLSNNTAGQGGGLFFFDSSVTLNNCNISNNNSNDNGNGGGVFGRGTLILNSSDVSSNTAAQSGGGISVLSGSELTLNDSTVASNTALASFGTGGIEGVQSTVVLNNSSVLNNQGSGLWGQDSALIAMQSVISNNVAIGNKYGGGISGFNDVQLTSSVVSGNSSLRGGGGISTNRLLTIENSIISNNSAANNAGGISAIGLNQKLYINNSTISNNTAGGIGGGLVVSTFASLNLSNSTIHGNLSTNGGGGIDSNQATLFLDNSTISGNSSAIGGAIRTFSSDMNINNLTIAYNESSNNCSALYTQASDINLTNSIIAGNTASGTTLNEVCLNGGVQTINNNLFGENSKTSEQAFTIGAIPSDTNIIATSNGNMPTLLSDIITPLSDNGGPTLTHGLPQGSPAIDAGNNSTCAALGDSDQRGEPRPQGASCDIGAFERELEPETETSFFVVPLPNGQSVIFDL